MTSPSRPDHIATPGGMRLAHDGTGDPDAPVLLLISGLGTQMTRWTDPFRTALAARGYRVIRFDNRDAGLSSRVAAPAPDFATLAADLMAGRQPQVPYTLQDMTADARALLDALGIDRAHVVGRSMGGMIAQMLAAEAPDRVLSLTSIMSGTGNPGLPQADPQVMALMTGPRPDPATDPDGFLTHHLAFARRIAGSGSDFDADAEAALALADARRAPEPAGTGRQLAAMATAGDRRPRLAQITAPTLVIHGTEDPLIPPDHGRDTAAAIPGAELLLIDGMGHDLPPAVHPQIIDAIDRTARRTD